MSWAEVKHALNSTLGTDEFYALDKLINIRLSQFNSFQNIIYNEPGNYTYTVPDGIYMLYVSAAAGGGGGGGCSDRYGGGGGGGAAVFNRAIFVEPGEQISITIGAGGAGGAYDSSGTGETGENGGNTIFGSYFTLLGGKGGTGGSTTGGDGGAAGGEGGGVGGTYDNNSTPQPGITGPVAPTDSGAYCHFGGGGSLGTGGYLGQDIDDTSPLNGGGGSGGNYNTSSSFSRNGQNGANGIVFITAVRITEEQANATSIPSSISAIKNIQRGVINSYGFGQYSITLSGFSDERNMFVLLDFANSDAAHSFGLHLYSLTTNKLTVFLQNADTTGSYQVIEFA